MKDLKNALLLKQLATLKSMGFRYTDLNVFKESDSVLLLPNDLKSLKNQAFNCHLCELSKSRTNVVFGEGNEHADILFVGEGPGATEDMQGKPFVGKSGELLTKMIENVLEIKREDVYIANIVKCRPPNNRVPTTEEAFTCRPYLFKQIELIKPKLVITLGSTAYEYLTDDTTPISQIRGVIRKENNYTVIPTYHPSYLLRNPSAKKEVFADLLKAKSLLSSLK